MSPGDPWPYPQFQWSPAPALQKDLLDEFKKSYRLLLERSLLDRIERLFSDEGEFSGESSELRDKLRFCVTDEVYDVLRDDPLWP